MSKSGYLTGQCLIAMPQLQDPYFHRTVVYLCEHTDEGAVGFIINRPIGYKLEFLFAQMKITAKPGVAASPELLAGGPLQLERGFVLHQPIGNWQSSLVVSEDTAVTSSQDILEALALGLGPAHCLVCLGYSAWEAGQLEKELIENAWLTCAADPKLLYETTFSKRWSEALNTLGVDPSRLFRGSGRA